jgi:O-methyltransferase
MMSSAEQKLSLTLSFPLADGRDLIDGPLTYKSDGLATKHSTDWMSEPRFARAYQAAMETGHRFGPDLHVEWRVYLPCWAASVAIKLDGDFVECGVDTGICSRAICSYLGFERYTNRRFYLLDTFEGFPAEQLTDRERTLGLEDHYAKYYGATHDLVRHTFSTYPNVVLIKGRVPETLSQVQSEKIAYLALDMNAAIPERAAIEYFWERLVPGAPVVLDDYGYSPGHEAQKATLDEFAALHNVSIFTLPSGQGLLLKPPATA